MRALITGTSGLVGNMVAHGLTSRGWQVLSLGRHSDDHISYRLGDAPDLPQADILVHCAFEHIAGRYRGGEGSDADGFHRQNLEGSLRLFDAAKAAGLPRLVFLSSRAVYGDQTAGLSLNESTTPHPDSLYGAVKLETEQALASLASADFIPISIRATGIYGSAPAGRPHKWASLFQDFLGNRPIPPRVSTELHGDDLAAAIALLAGTASAGIYNASDIVLDRADLLAEVARIAKFDGKIPTQADPSTLNVMKTDKLAALGWRPGGTPKLLASLPDLVEAAGPFT